MLGVARPPARRVVGLAIAPLFLVAPHGAPPAGRVRGRRSKRVGLCSGRRADFWLCDVAGNRAAGLDTPTAWKFAAIIDPICVDGATPADRRKAMQTICLEIFRSYEIAFAELRGEAPGYVFEQRFIVDLDENTTFTLQFWIPGTAKLCYLCDQLTANVFSGPPPAGIFCERHILLRRRFEDANMMHVANMRKKGRRKK